MARIRHVAFSSEDPAKTAEFYKKFFGLTELYRKPSDTGEYGVYLSDGYIFVAIGKRKSSDSPTDSFKHLGFDVDSLEETCAALKTANVTFLEKNSTATQKFLVGPDGVNFEARERGWDEEIQTKMQLYQLTPVAPVK